METPPNLRLEPTGPSRSLRSRSAQRLIRAPLGGPTDELHCQVLAPSNRRVNWPGARGTAQAHISPLPIAGRGVTPIEVLEELKKLAITERLTIIEVALHLIREDLQQAVIVNDDAVGILPLKVISLQEHMFCRISA